MNIFSRHPFRHEPSGDDDQSLQLDENERRSRWLPQHWRRRHVIWTGLGLLIVAVAFGCWLGVRALDAKSNLEQARHSAQQAKEALLQGDTEDASHWADSAQSHAQAARDAAHSLPWNIVAAVPWLGSPFKTGQQISDVVLGAGNRRVAAVRACRRGARSRPVARRRAGRRATPPQRGT